MNGTAFYSEIVSRTSAGIAAIKAQIATKKVRIAALKTQIATLKPLKPKSARVGIKRVVLICPWFISATLLVLFWSTAAIWG